MVITIIALIIALFSLGISLSVLREGHKAAKELDGIIADLKKEKEQSHPTEVSASLGEVAAIFDHNSKTLFLDGNIEASGYISAGCIKAK